MATRLLEGGDRVAGTGHNTAALKKTAARYGDAFRPATLDVTDTAAVKDSIDRAAAAPGNLDAAAVLAAVGVTRPRSTVVTAHVSSLGSS